MLVPLLWVSLGNVQPQLVPRRKRFRRIAMRTWKSFVFDETHAVFAPKEKDSIQRISNYRRHYHTGFKSLCFSAIFLRIRRVECRSVHFSLTLTCNEVRRPYDGSVFHRTYCNPTSDDNADEIGTEVVDGKCWRSNIDLKLNLTFQIKILPETD